MKTAPHSPDQPSPYEGLSASDLLAILAEKDAFITAREQQVQERDRAIRERDTRIKLLEEQLRLATIRKFAASSEKLPFQITLFDEVELEAALRELDEQLDLDGTPDDQGDAAQQRRRSRKRQRGFSAALRRERIELLLADADKEGALKTFFSKVKEELSYIPPQLKVIEYWQEKAVFAVTEAGGIEERIVAAPRPVPPLGKCFAHSSLLAYLITAKYADGLPLYRLEGILKREGHGVSRSVMANWIIRLEDVFRPLMNLLREEQNSCRYLQADETRIQVLKEDGKTAQAQKWMWVTRGGPPDRPSVLFAYDPSRSGEVAERLLDGFTGILQADGYSGYGAVCKQQGIRRIGCWDHARRKFVEASRASPAGGGKGKQGRVSKADVALSYIRRLYAIEREIADRSPAEKYRARQALSVPKLAEFKAWLTKNQSRVLKDSLTRKAIDYALNQWELLLGYCDDGELNISNALAENAIRPFAVGRKAWLFADTTRGAHASATMYSLIETAKANSLEPRTYLLHILERIGAADTVEKLEALLPWNVDLPRFEKNVSAYPRNK
jgi:transposase|tara:strand:+ start:793 stop:2463 length:1671 start_codon:yes stop_codon:yes gene_type:complete